MKAKMTRELFVTKTVTHSPCGMSSGPTHFIRIITSQVQNSITCIFLKTGSQAQPAINRETFHVTPVTTLSTVLFADL